MEFLQELLDSTQAPFLTALILGLMTAISPCPLATNITAIGFISKDIAHKRRIFINGIVYTLGRSISYTGIGLILYFGVDMMPIKKLFLQNGEKFIGPLMLIIGFLMLDFIKIKFPAFTRLSEKIENNSRNGAWWTSLLLGMLFALAFCPYSGVLYFGMLIPITVSSASGLYLPIVFAIATGLPVIIIAWLLAYSVSSVGGLYNKIKVFEKWFRRIVAVLFMLVGIYYMKIYLKI